MVHGPDEVDIVFSGLEDTMINACMETRLAAIRLVRASVARMVMRCPC